MSRSCLYNAICALINGLNKSLARHPGAPAKKRVTDELGTCDPGEIVDWCRPLKCSHFGYLC